MLTDKERATLETKMQQLAEEIPPGLPRLQWLKEHQMRLERMKWDQEFTAFNLEIIRHQMDRLSVLVAMHQLAPDAHQRPMGEGPQKGSSHPNGDPTRT